LPNRLLRDGICTSDAINSLTEAEEVFFYRLVVVCDDYGYADARLSILKAQCFPLRDTATTQKIDQWLEGLSAKGLIVRYQKDGKPFLAVNKWEQRVRSRQKHPGPTDDGCVSLEGCQQAVVSQLSDNCLTDDRLGKGKGKGKGATSRASRELRSLPDDWTPSIQTVEKLSKEFGLRVPEDVDKYVDAFRDACLSRGYKYMDFDAAFRKCVGQDWPKLRNVTGKAVSGFVI
jgi:hypothetical protein